MNPALTHFNYAALFIDIGWGLLGLTIILIFHGSAINHLIMKFDSAPRRT